MSHRRASGALAVALCIGCTAPATAAALEPGVHIDPGSPSAKEYGVPLWVLRGEASGHQSPEGIPPPPLFGEGIGSAGGRTNGGPPQARGRGGRSASGSAAGAAGGRAAVGRQPGSGSSPTVSAAAIAELNRQGSATPEVALAAGGVVVGGLVLGGAFVLARRRLAR